MEAADPGPLDGGSVLSSCGLEVWLREPLSSARSPHDAEAIRVAPLPNADVVSPRNLALGRTRLPEISAQKRLQIKGCGSVIKSHPLLVRKQDRPPGLQAGKSRAGPEKPGLKGSEKRKGRQEP